MAKKHPEIMATAGLTGANVKPLVETHGEHFAARVGEDRPLLDPDNERLLA